MKFILFLIVSLFSTASVAMQNLTIALDSQLNNNHAPLVIAKNKGFFKEQNLNVKFIVPTKTADAVTLITKNQAEVGLVYEPQYIKLVDKGTDLIQIGTLIDKPLSCLIVLKDSKIKQLADLKGKRIGIKETGIASTLLKTMLAKADLSLADVSVITINGDLNQALLTHKVDAIAGAMRNNDIPQLELSTNAVRAFFPEEHGIPNFSELVFVSKMKNSHDMRLQHFLSALKKAIRYMDENPESSWVLFSKQQAQLNNAINKEAWFITLSYFAEDPSSIDLDEWKHFAEFMQNNQLIEKIQPTSRYVALNNTMLA